MFGAEYPQVPDGRARASCSTSRCDATFPDAATVRADGRPLRVAAGEEVRLPAGTVDLPGGIAMPVAEGTDAQRGSDWAAPVSDTGDASPLFVYSLLIATFLGTMGLPHILVRFYTNRDGPAARRTTVRVLGLLGLFYAFPSVYGALGRVLTPELYLTGETDTVVLRLPEAAWPGLGGELLGALVAAGAFAAFMSTASGLLVSLAGTVTHDVGRRAARGAAERRRRFRAAALGAMVVPALLALVARGLDISVLVGWAFALAASTFCPLLLLGIWWDRLTARGAACGLVVGALAATAAIFTGLVVEPDDRSLDALLTQPAVLSVPLAFATMALVSLLDRRAPRPAAIELLALHAPRGWGSASARRTWSPRGPGASRASHALRSRRRVNCGITDAIASRSLGAPGRAQRRARSDDASPYASSPRPCRPRSCRSVRRWPAGADAGRVPSMPALTRPTAVLPPPAAHARAARVAAPGAADLAPLALALARRGRRRRAGADGLGLRLRGRVPRLAAPLGRRARLLLAHLRRRRPRHRVARPPGGRLAARRAAEEEDAEHEQPEALDHGQRPAERAGSGGRR